MTGVFLGRLSVSTTLFLASVGLSSDPPLKFKGLQQPEGVRLYGNGVDVVQEIDLSAGVSLQLFDDRAIAPGEASQADDYGNFPQYDTGVSVRVRAQPLRQHWHNLVEDWGDRAFSVFNGQFFGSSPLQLAFPVKANGTIYSGGYAGEGEYAGEKVLLAISGDEAQILPFPEVGFPENPLFSPVPDLIVGLNEWADKGIKRNVGRTFVGVGDRDGNGTNETLWVLTSPRSTQLRASRVLQAFGASAVMMLDGGGSTQLMVRGVEFVRSSDKSRREIPHAIGVILPERQSD
ncbi:phosphodiester glycosidase family protein [Baaleninema simplex]|uniref:phosphodiester glycosidase family protein n=1 Tax=Baaleninema simplex TaxID=2862350 RepID=UPI00034DABB7|nr:phosphodiester glycosidase family protein [Baaleninema simplex]